MSYSDFEVVPRVDDRWDDDRGRVVREQRYEVFGVVSRSVFRLHAAFLVLLFIGWMVFFLFAVQDVHDGWDFLVNGILAFSYSAALFGIAYTFTRPDSYVFIKEFSSREVAERYVLFLKRKELINNGC